MIIIISDSTPILISNEHALNTGIKQLLNMTGTWGLILFEVDWDDEFLQKKKKREKKREIEMSLSKLLLLKELI